MAGFKTVVAMNAFKGGMSAVEASSMVAEGFSRGFWEAQVVAAPMADGGDGTLEVLLKCRGGYVETVSVTGPYGQTVEAPLGFIDGGTTAVIESASCSGLALPYSGKRDVRIAQSRGVGELMLAAAKKGVKRIVVGIGGTAMNDGGLGAALAAGGEALDAAGDPVSAGVFGLRDVRRVSRGDIPRLFDGIEVVAITDVKNPLVGPEGATAVFGPQKGLSAGEVPLVDSYMANYAEALARDLGRNPKDLPMTGAGGGLAAGLWAFFGAELKDGAAFVAGAIDLPKIIEDASLVITGEGKVDSQTSMGKVPFAVASLAAEAGVPVVVIGGALGEEVVRGFPPEFAAVFDCTLRPMTVSEAVSEGPKNLLFVSEQIARLARACAVWRPTQTDLAVGGIAVRRDPDTGDREVLLIMDRFGMVAPPKGHPEEGETLEEAAEREVREETGLSVVSRAPIGSVRYRFPNPQGATEKVVHYFLMEVVGGEMTPQQGETLQVLWVNEKDLPGLRTYKDTHSIVKKALSAFERVS